MTGLPKRIAAMFLDCHDTINMENNFFDCNEYREQLAGAVGSINEFNGSGVLVFTITDHSSLARGL